MTGFGLILFDLDGTLADSKVGITNSIRDAVHELGGQLPTNDDLGWCVGPPMREVFARLLDTHDRDKLTTAYSLYLRRYSESGIFDNHLFPGVKEMLERLSSAGVRRAVVTSKITANARRVLEILGIDRFFELVIGSEPDGTMADKREAVSLILRQLAAGRVSTAIVGDREHDVFAGKANGISTIGVTYGYGSRAELGAAGADVTCETPAEVADFVLGRAENAT